jgi:hypothetical protein
MAIDFKDIEAEGEEFPLEISHVEDVSGTPHCLEATLDSGVPSIILEFPRDKVLVKLDGANPNKMR